MKLEKCAQTDVAKMNPSCFGLLKLLVQVLLHSICYDCLCNKKCVLNVLIVWVRLEKGFRKGDFLSLPPKHFVFAFSFIFGDAHIASHDLFDGHQEGDGYFLTLKFGEGLPPCLHHLNLVVFVFEHCDVKENLGWRFHWDF